MSQFQRQSCGREGEGGGGGGGATPIQNYGNYHVPGKTNVKTVFDFEEPQTDKTGEERLPIQNTTFSPRQSLKARTSQKRTRSVFG